MVWSVLYSVSTCMYVINVYDLYECDASLGVVGLLSSARCQVLVVLLVCEIVSYPNAFLVVSYDCFCLRLVCGEMYGSGYFHPKE